MGTAHTYGTGRSNATVCPHNPIQNCKNSMSGKVIMKVEIKEWSIPNENEQETVVMLYNQLPIRNEIITSDFISPNGSPANSHSLGVIFTHWQAISLLNLPIESHSF